jgi:cysteine desulfurase NifS/selenium donor protein
VKEPIYLDYNATTPIHPAVAAAMRPYLESGFGNPSSSHWYGVQARIAVEEARSSVARLIGAKGEEIVFTSGGSEANNYAIKGAALALREAGRGRHVVATSVEHPAVLEVLAWLETQGFRTTLLPVDSCGLVDPADFEKAMSSDTILLSVMHANNEVGTIEPVRELADIAHRAGVLVHSDAAQSTGKIPVSVEALGVDLLSIAGHKLYAPKGIGALYIRTGVRLAKLIHGASHERGLRAGTENVLEIVGLGAAAELAARELPERMRHTRELRDLLWQLLSEALPEIRMNGHPERRLPNTLSVSFPGIEADTLLSELEGVAASAGAACHADSVELSSVLNAMGLPLEYAMGTVRFSTGAFLSRAEVEDAAGQVVAAVRRLRPAAADAAPAASDFAAAAGEIKLTHFTHGLGCACKLRPQALERVLRSLPPVTDPRVLVGTETSDDAAVYRIDEKLGIVQTVDFFTPIVDDPYHFGAIAAANALSDIYAMGGTPLFALNIVGFPTNRLSLAVLEEILRGAADKAAEAGIPIVGGHSVDDTEPKFGMAVTGRIDPAKIYTNARARPGDRLVLTKSLGLGVLSTAMKRGLASAESVAAAIAVMERLNRSAAELLGRFDVGAVTDVTGFGLMGHLREMSRGSRVDMQVYADRVPMLDEARALAAAGMIPGGSRDNEALVADLADWAADISDLTRILLCDAQTSGGLLVSIAAGEAEAYVAALRAADCPEAAVIGECLAPGEGRIAVGRLDNLNN